MDKKEKVCSRCKSRLSLSCFSKHSGHKDGLSYYCKECVNTRQAELGSSKRWYENNKDRVKEKQKIRYNNNKDALLIKSRESWMKYYSKNKKELMDKKVKYNRERCKYDPVFKLKKNLRNRLRYALKRIKENKIMSSLELVGCSIEFLKSYLESRFDSSMSWENYGTYWEIDHKIPCAKFDLSDTEQQKKCFHYSNLQPLSSHENRSKSDRYISL